MPDRVRPPAWFVALTVVAAALVAAALVVVGVLAVRNPPTAPPDRAAFRAAVLGKDPAGVLAAVGRPDGTTPAGDGHGERWYYLSRVADPVARRPILSVVVEFSTGPEPVAADVRDGLL